MNFRKWLCENLETENLENLNPVKQIGKGHFATVFSTENPDIVMRISKQNSDNSCQKIMHDSKIQATGGVAKIYGRKTYGQFDITYKEKVNTKWYSYLAEKYENFLNKKYDISNILQMMHSGQETAKIFGETAAFIQIALEAFRSKDHIIDFLKNFKESSGIIKAIQMGLPFDDLHSDNLGINKNGDLVVIDC